jgi:serine/threonine protein kinase
MSKTTIGGRYILQQELGAGAMGTVYLAQDTATHEQVAVKALKSEVTQPEMIERFKREGEALRDLNHPNIVKMLDAFEHDGQYYLVMEYISSGDLSDLIQRHGKLDIHQCVDMAIDLADALTRAHRLNIIHRDLKPANILIGDDGVLCLTDFGVAHVGSKERVTETDAIIGTIDYLPPEAFDGTPFDARGDIWAFGVILFEMLAGERPFRGDTLFEVIQAISTQPIPDLEALCPDLPIALVDLVYRMLERNPQARIASVRRVGTELEDILQGRDQAVATLRFDTPLPDYSMRPKHNLPVQATPFIGREHELAELDNLLKGSTIRLITILAQGGMGKTRLVLELAQHAVDEGLYSDGVYFVELAPLSDADNIPNAIADAAGYQFLGEGTPKEQLLTILRERNLLLVMDNYEHLPEGFALVGDIMKSAPNVYIITTSRQRLSQAGETLFHLSGMDFPDWETPQDALEYAAVKLFMNSAKRVRPDFELTGNILDDVARICKLVQGMPLGIVLAASWLAVLYLSQIADEIQDSLDFLETDETDLPERQRSIRAVMDYSWAQMTEAEQQVFMKLSVFRGGFTREAAQVVAGANLRNLMSLVNNSLIRRDTDSGHYEIHELLRQYTEEHLQQSGEFDALNQRHLQYFAEFMANRTPDIKGRRQLGSFHEIEADFENIRVAWHHAIDSVNYDALDQMMEALNLFCDMRSLFQTGIDLFKNAMNVLSPLNINVVHPVFNRVRVRYVFMWTQFHQKPVPESMYHHVQTSLIYAQDNDDLHTVALCMLTLDELECVTGDWGIVLQYSEQARQQFEQLNSMYYVGRSLRQLMQVLNNQGELAELEHRQEIHQQLVDITRRIGDRSGMSHALMHQPSVEDISQSLQLFREAAVIAREMGDFKSLAFYLTFQAEHLLVQGRFDQAKPLCHEAIPLFHNSGWYFDEPSVILAIIALLNDDILFLSYAAHGTVEEMWIPSIQPDFYRIKKALGYGALAYFEAQNTNQHILSALQLVAERFFPNTAAGCVAIVATFLVEDGKHQQATELLGLAFEYRYDYILGWMDKAPRLTRTRDQLKTELGEQAYNTAWERGKSLDLETVIQELIIEFSEDD